jgi:hypothetical protein
VKGYRCLHCGFGIKMRERPKSCPVCHGVSNEQWLTDQRRYAGKLEVVIDWRRWAWWKKLGPFPVGGPFQGKIYRWRFQIGPFRVRRWAA